jgi:Cu/Zn superoxide dismutase
MKKLLTLFTALLVFTIAGYSQVNGKLLVTAKLSGSQEVPAVNTGASGVAGFLFNAQRDSLFINIAVANLSGPITGIHIHEAAKGTNGGVIKDLSTFVVGNAISTVVTGTDLTAEMITKLLSGKYYVNLHTAANANGEIRGQLEPEADWGFYGTLNGSQEVPATNSTATGWVVTSLSKNKEMVHVWAVVKDLSGPIMGAHFHSGAAGSNGAVVADLSTFVSGNTIVASIPATAFVDDLLAGNIYINVHTATEPNGEVRAQMIWSDKLNFVSWLDGAQEVPATTAVGKGVALLRLNQSMDSLWYDVLIDSVSGAIGGAHIHSGAKGANGGVSIDLSAGISGNMLSGVVTGLTKANISDLMKGNAYINAHTTANANGEVRGQVMSLTRTGFTVLLNGLQEVPPVVTTAMGSGIVSVDGMMTNAHYMFVVNGLSGPVNGAHFHNAAMGVNGSVVHDISASFGKVATSDTAFGYWKNLTATDAMNLLNGTTYINIHTAANANGEMRGQVNDEGKTSQLPTGIFSTPTAATATVYPNPAASKLFIALDGEQNGDVTIKVMDLQGKQMLVNTTSAAGNAEINVNSLPAGMYILNIETNGVLQIARFVKQ